MRNYRQSDNYRRSGKREYSRDRGARRPEMHDAICDECGKECKVPFKPSGNKPVYCSDCFEHQSGQSERSSGRRDSRDSRNYRDSRNSRRRDYPEKRMYSAICDECGKECEVPFKPTGDKPIFCSDCFGGKRTSSKGSDKREDNKQLQKQIDVMNSKLDSIIQTLKSLVAVEEKPEKESKESKTAKTVSKKTEPRKNDTKKKKKKKEKALKPTTKSVKKISKKTVKKEAKTTKTKKKKSTSKKK